MPAKGKIGKVEGAVRKIGDLLKEGFEAYRHPKRFGYLVGKLPESDRKELLRSAEDESSETLEESIELCKKVDRWTPFNDFGELAKDLKRIKKGEELKELI